MAADFEEPAHAAVLRKVTTDLAAKGIAVTEPQLRARMDELMAQAFSR